MDRNEVLLVGRLSAAAEERSLPSGDTMTKWRLLVRRRRPNKRGGTITDSIPCVSFDPEVAGVLRGLKPRDTMEVTGAFRCRVFGPASGKIWTYEVEAATVTPLDAAMLDDPSGAPASAAGNGATGSEDLLGGSLELEAPVGGFSRPAAPRPVAVLAKAG